MIVLLNILELVRIIFIDTLMCISKHALAGLRSSTNYVRRYIMFTVASQGGQDTCKGGVRADS